MRMMTAGRARFATLTLAALALTACSGILGIGEFSEQQQQGSAADDGDPPGGGGAGTGGETGESGKDIWIRTFGATGTDTGRALAVDGVGSLYMAGDLADEVDFGNGEVGQAGQPGGVFITKLDEDGGWGSGSYSTTSTGAQDAQVEGLAVRSSDGSAVVVGHYRSSSLSLGALQLDEPLGSDIFFAKLDANGDPSQVGFLPAAGEQRALSVAIDPNDGGIVMVGSMSADVDFGAGLVGHAGGQDAFAAKMDAAGQNLLWAWSIGDDADQLATAVVVDADSRVFVGGTFAGAIALDETHMSASGSDIFVAELDAATGAAVRSRSFGVKGASHELGAMALSTAGLVIAGTFAGDTAFGGEHIGSAFVEGAPQRLEDIYVAELDRAFDPGWARAYGGTNSELGKAVAVGGDGSIVVGGCFADQFLIGDEVIQGQGSGDALVLMLDAAGELLWARGFGRNDYDATLGVAFDGAGDVVIAGLFQQGFKLNLNEDPYLAAGLEDIFLVKLHK